MTVSETRWWIGLNGQSVGPWSRAEIDAAIKKRDITAQTLVCPVRGQAWIELSQVPELVALLPPPATPLPPIQPQSLPTAVPVFPEINPYASPQVTPSSSYSAVAGWTGMASAVTNYCLFFAPIYHGVFLLISLASLTTSGTASPAETFHSVLDFGIRVALVMLMIRAGLKWQQRDSSAIPATYIPLIMGFCWSAFGLLLLIASSGFQDDSEDPLMGLYALIALVAFGLLIWEIVITIWLSQHAKNLPWRQPIQRSYP